MMDYELGVVIPVYNSEHSVGGLCAALLAYFAHAGVAGRVVLVDDGSTDGSAEIIDKLAGAAHVTAAHLKRNSGQQSALLCGLKLAQNCKYLVTMDDDLQHPTRLLDALRNKISEGYDLVYATPQGGRKPLYRRLGSLMRDALFALFTAKPRGIKVSAYRIMTNALAAKICAKQQQFVYLSASAFCFAPKTANIQYQCRARVYGRSGYTLGKLARTYALLFLYYTRLGAWFCPRHQRPPYELKSMSSLQNGQDCTNAVGVDMSIDPKICTYHEIAG